MTRFIRRYPLTVLQRHNMIPRRLAFCSTQMVHILKDCIPTSPSCGRQTSSYTTHDGFSSVFELFCYDAVWGPQYPIHDLQARNDGPDGKRVPHLFGWTDYQTPYTHKISARSAQLGEMEADMGVQFCYVLCYYKHGCGSDRKLVATTTFC